MDPSAHRLGCSVAAGAGIAWQTVQPEATRILVTHRRPLLIDTDPGVDDAWAILMAASAPQVELVGLTVVGGNVGLDCTVRNACALVDLIGRPIPVHSGAARPLVAQTEDAGHVHGRDGFGDVDLPRPATSPTATAAANAIVELAQRWEGQLEIIALGPLTNLALALRLDPQLPQRVARLLVMGGAIDGPGNTTPFAEFNIGFDPEAAEVVFREWPTLELVDWVATLREAPPVGQIEQLLAGDSPKARFMHQISRCTAAFVAAKGAQNWAFADPLAMLAMLDPAQVVATSEGAIAVELVGERRGETRLGPIDGERARSRIHQHFHQQALARALELALD